MEASCLKCAIITKQSDGSLLQCNRLAFKPLTKELVDVVVKKNLPLYFDSLRIHRLTICVAHRRMVQNVGKFNDSYQKLSAANHEVSEQRELQEFLDEFVAHCRRRLMADGLIGASTYASETDDDDDGKTTAEKRFENLYERYRSYDDVYDAPAASSSSTLSAVKNHRPQTSSDDVMVDKPSELDDSKIPFASLSTMTLRRYKKFFKLPNRSGASSKPQLLEGIYEHVESIPVDQAETAAFFMYTLRNRRNELDHPNGGGGVGGDGMALFQSTATASTKRS